MSVISTASNTVTTTIPVNSQPIALAVSPDGTKVYVGSNAGGSNAVDIISSASKTVTASFGTPGPVRDLALTPDGSKLYIAMEFSGLASVLTATNSLTVISTVVCPEGVSVSPNGSQLYVAYQCGGPGGSAGHDALGVFAVATDSFIGSVTGLPNVGGFIAFSPNGAQIWENGNDACGNPAYDHVGCPSVPGVPEAIVNLVAPGGTIGSPITTLGFTSTEGVGMISFFPNSQRALVGGGDLKVIETTGFSVVQRVSLPASGSVAFTPDGHHAYAPVPSQNAVAFLATN